MASKQLNSGDSYVTKFNHNLTLLLTQLSKAYPDDKDLKIWGEKFEWSKSFNARLACEAFLEVVGPFLEKIMTKDERFFLDFDYNSIVPDQKYQRLIGKMMSLWAESDNERLKDNIWKYFQTLLTYSILANRSDKYLEQINQHRKTPLSF